MPPAGLDINVNALNITAGSRTNDGYLQSDEIDYRHNILPVARSQGLDVREPRCIAGQCAAFVSRILVGT